MVNVIFYRKHYKIKCRVLDGQLTETIPKSLVNLGEINTTHAKRKASTSNTNLINPQASNRSKNVIASSDDESQSEKSQSQASVVANSILPTAMLAINLISSDINNLEEFSVQDLYDMAKKGEFPKKVFIFGQDKSTYTQRLQFFTSIRIFSDRPKGYLSFVCKICEVVISAKFPEFNNLNNHLKIHDDWRKNWLL